MTQPEETIESNLRELAGAASLCWQPKPTGVFDPEQAEYYVKQTLLRLNSLIEGIERAARLDELDRVIQSSKCKKSNCEVEHQIKKIDIFFRIKRLKQLRGN